MTAREYLDHVSTNQASYDQAFDLFVASVPAATQDDFQDLLLSMLERVAEEGSADDETSRS